jgi:hypothetical protein
MADVLAAPHDRSSIDRAAQPRWMPREIELQRELAALLIAHADVSEKVRAQLEA